jgi:peptide/nickel transport system permease protein
VKPYIILFPAIFLSVTVLAVNLLGDGLRDALDPRMAKRL